MTYPEEQLVDAVRIVLDANGIGDELVPDREVIPLLRSLLTVATREALGEYERELASTLADIYGPTNMSQAGLSKTLN